jgi:hypothetical protein
VTVRLVQIYCLLIVIFPVLALGHDIGVTRAELVESENGGYALIGSFGPAAAFMHPTPLLPEHCDYVGNPRGVQGPGGHTWEFSCEPSLTSEDRLELPWRRDGAMVKANWKDGSVITRLYSLQSGSITVELADLQAGSGSWMAAAGRYTELGIEHILGGIDHLLFVFALLIIVSSGWMLLKTITAFTVAHSITLGLATLGFVNFPPRPVEAVIALSIVFLAVEILHARQGRRGLTYRTPWVVAFGFGLLHGFGFAGALSEIGLPQSEIPIALLFFNIGVEIGQLAFVLAIVSIKMLFDRFRTSWPRMLELCPVYLIGTIATYWLIERVNAMFSPV